MSGQTTKWTDIARTGTFTAMNGEDVTFTEKDLDTLVANFDPDNRRVPLVFGHPATDGPAQGWVAAVRRQGAKLQARFDQVSDGVKNAVKNGQFGNVSIRKSRDGCLMHVGLLGARPPAIDGLGPVEFALHEEDNSQVIAFAVAPPATAQTAIPQEGTTVDKNNEETQSLRDALKKSEEQAAALATKLEAATSTLEKVTQEFAAAEKQKLRTDREERVNKLITDGKILPNQKGEVLEFAAHLGDHVEPLEFAASDGTKLQMPLETAFFSLLENFEGNNLTQEFATPEAAGETDRNTFSGSGNAAANM